MNLNDKGLIVDYIYALLQSNSEEFRKSSHVDNYYSEDCHRILCNYFRIQAYPENSEVVEVYANLLSMLNLWTGRYYDEEPFTDDTDSWYVFGEDFSYIQYRCFIVPLSSQDTDIGSFVTNISTSEYGSIIYRFTTRDSLHKIITDTSDKSNRSIWSPIETIGSTTRNIPVTDSQWKYLIIGVPAVDNITNILVSHVYNDLLVPSIIESYNSEPWMVHDEIIPYLLNRCISPLSHPDDIWSIQKRIARYIDYTHYTAGVWDPYLKNLLVNIALQKTDSLFRFGYFTPKIESALNSAIGNT